MSQETLAERARLSADAVGALERGVRRIPQRHTLALLVEALGISGADRERLEAAAVREPQPRVRGVAAAALRGGLPRPLTTFVDREQDASALADLVSGQRLVTVTGPGGVGKTRLAIEVGRAVAQRYRDGAAFVDLAPLNAESFVAAEIASVLGIEGRSSRPLREQLIAALRSKHLLLIVDNCEHLIDAAAETLGALLAAAPRLTVLATSREALRIGGERVYPLPPLPIDAGVALFGDRAKASDPAFTLSDANGRDVAEICRRLDGIPLAIELGAAKVAMMSPKELSRRISERFDLLTEGKRDALPRHQTLRALIGWSYLLLSEQERTMLRALSVFTGSWTLSSCTALCAALQLGGDTVSLLSSLIAKSLVMLDRRTDEEARYRLPESMREYGLQRLREEGELGAAYRAHAQYVVSFAREAERSIGTSEQSDWLALVERSFDDVRAAVESTLRASGSFSVGSEIVARLGLFWCSRRYHEGAHWLGLALRHLDELERPLAAQLLVTFVRSQPYTPRTLEFAERSVDLYRRIDDPGGLRCALEYLGQSLMNLDRFEEAERALDEAATLARGSGDVAVLGRTLALTGFVRLYLQDLDAADALFREAAQVASVAGQKRDLALASRGHAELALSSGDPDGALAHAFGALELFERLEDGRAAAWQRSQIARALLESGRISEALPYARHAVRDLRDAEVPIPFVEAVVVAAALLVALGNAETAGKCLAFCSTQSEALTPFRIDQPFATLALNAERALAAALSPSQLTSIRASGKRLDREAIVALVDR
jgi:predicted ATPase